MHSSDITIHIKPPPPGRVPAYKTFPGQLIMDQIETVNPLDDLAKRVGRPEFHSVGSAYEWISNLANKLRGEEAFWDLHRDLKYEIKGVFEISSQDDFRHLVQNLLRKVYCEYVQNREHASQILLLIFYEQTNDVERQVVETAVTASNLWKSDRTSKDQTAEIVRRLTSLDGLLKQQTQDIRQKTALYITQHLCHYARNITSCKSKSPECYLLTALLSHTPLPEPAPVVQQRRISLCHKLSALWRKCK